jgi:hypothetical protein
MNTHTYDTGLLSSRSVDREDSARVGLADEGDLTKVGARRPTPKLIRAAAFLALAIVDVGRSASHGAEP